MSDIDHEEVSEIIGSLQERQINLEQEIESLQSQLTQAQGDLLKLLNRMKGNILVPVNLKGEIVNIESEKELDILKEKLKRTLAETIRLGNALYEMDDLTYSFDSRKRMEEIRKKALED